MNAKMILLLFVMGVILGGCSVKSNKDILLDDTKTIIKYSPYQKMFILQKKMLINIWEIIDR